MRGASGTQYYLNPFFESLSDHTKLSHNTRCIMKTHATQTMFQQCADAHFITTLHHNAQITCFGLRILWKPCVFETFLLQLCGNRVGLWPMSEALWQRSGTLTNERSSVATEWDSDQWQKLCGNWVVLTDDQWPKLYSHIYIYVCVCVCVCVCMYVCIRAYIYVYVCVYIRAAKLTRSFRLINQRKNSTLKTQINHTSIVHFDPICHLRWKKMEADKKMLHGPVNRKFKLKNPPDGTVDREIVLCISVVWNFPITGVHQPLNITSKLNTW